MKNFWQTLAWSSLVGLVAGCAAREPAPCTPQPTPFLQTDLPASSSQVEAAPPPQSAPRAESDSEAQGLDAMLTNYDYPHEVHHFEFESQGQHLLLAYMLVEPEKPTAKGTVTLLHGKNFSGAYWKTTSDALVQAGYRVLIPDQIGFGKSSKPVDFQYSFHELARETRLLWEALGIEKSHVVGHSMGGMLATRLALQAPQRTASLVLVNPIGLEDWKRVVPYHDVDSWTAQNEKATPSSIKAYMESSYFDGKWKPEYDPLLRLQAGWAVGPDRARIARVSALHYDMIFTQPVLYEFEDIAVPTLLVIGQRDRTALGKNWVSQDVAKTMGNYPELGKKTQRAIEGSRLVELPGTGHIPMVESYQQWIEALLEFLRSERS